MLLAFHQPNYLPNPGFFYKMAEVDLFVVATNVQFVRREWQSRAKLPGPNGDLLITVPVLGSNRQPIRDARVDPGERWRRKHARTLEKMYARLADPAVLNALLAIYSKPHRRLADVNLDFILLIKDLLRIQTRIVVDEEASGSRHELVINICRKHGASHYLSGVGGRLYMDGYYVEQLEKHGIRYSFVGRNVTAEHPYSSVHYLLGHGVEQARRIVRPGGGDGPG